MTVFKYFIKIALNYKYIIIGYLAIFMTFAIVFTASGTSQDEMGFQETKLNVGVVNRSESELSNALVDYLGNEHNIANMEEDEDEIKEAIFLQTVEAVVIIPQNFEEAVINREQAIEIFRDDRITGSYQVQNQMNKFISFAGGTYSNGEFQLDLVSEALDNTAEVRMLESQDGLNQDGVEWFQFYFKFVAYIILAIYIMVIGMVMSDFTVEEVENRRKLSAISFLKFNREIYLGQFTLALFLTAILILGSVILQGSHISQVSFSKYILNTSVFSIMALCLVYLIVNITTNKYAMSGLGTVLSLGLSFIGGVFVPQKLLGENVLNIARFFPTYYYVRANDMDITSILDIKFELFMQLLFAFAFLIVGLYLSKAKQKS